MGDNQRLDTYLQEGRLLQLATSHKNQPWVCTVYFVADKSRKLYWLSYPSRRHSQELATNSRAAVTVVIRPDLPVIGVQAEGIVSEVVDEDLVRRIMDLYVAKYGEGQKFYDNFVAGTNKHHMYCFTPDHYKVFDELHTD